jgi:hypothetical protein
MDPSYALKYFLQPSPINSTKNRKTRPAQNKSADLNFHISWRRKPIALRRYFSYSAPHFDPRRITMHLKVMFATLCLISLGYGGTLHAATTLRDAVASLQTTAGSKPSVFIRDIDRDGKIGLPEAVHALQIAADLRPDTSADDPLFTYQWHMKNTGQKTFSSGAGKADEDLRMTKALDDGLSGMGVIIAVLDNGLVVSFSNLAMETIFYETPAGADIENLRKRLQADPRIRRVTLDMVDRIRRPR